MNHDQLSTTLDAMNYYGGGFVSKLSDAWRYADAENQARLAAAFPHLLAQYGPGTVFFEAVTTKDNE